MALFYDQPGISELLRQLDRKVVQRFDRVAEIDAEEIARDVIDDLGLDAVCSDIDGAIQYAEDEGIIHNAATSNTTYDADNELLYMFAPWPEKNEVDLDEVAEVAKNSDNPVEEGIANYAYQLWVAAIKKSLKKVFEEKCKLLRG